MAQQVLRHRRRLESALVGPGALSLTYLGLPLAEKIYALTAKGEKA